MDDPKNPQGTGSAGKRSAGIGGNTDSVTTETRTEWDTVTRRYRRGLGGPWLLALIGVPALLAALGTGLSNDDDNDNNAGNDGSNSASPSDESAAEEAGNLSATRSGNEIVLRGVVPSDDAKATLVADVEAALPGVSVVDELTIEEGAPDVSAEPIAAGEEAVGDADFGFNFNGSAVTLTGPAASEAAKTAAGEAATAAFPNATVNNKLVVTGAGEGEGTGADQASCDTLQADIDGITDQTKITFANNGTDLTAASLDAIDEIAQLWTACDTAKLTIEGHASAVGPADLNQRLSDQRARIVADALADAGVASDALASEGKGESDQIAPNDTEEGQEANRRVEIIVSEGGA